MENSMQLKVCYAVSWTHSACPPASAKAIQL